MSIYVVDDNSHICEFLAYLLSSEGYKVHTFALPGEALDYLQSTGVMPRMLISDYNLPAMNGYQLHQALQGQAPAMRTIIISGRRLGGEVGDLPFLQKPFPPEQLMNLVHAYLPAG
ncbi:MAG: response regulator [Mariprofundus sp.]